MDPTRGMDPVSPWSFTAEQIVDLDSPKSADDFFFFAQLSCFMTWNLSFFFWLWMIILKLPAFNYIVVRNKIPRVLAGLLCLHMLLAVQQAHKGIQGVRGFLHFAMHFGVLVRAFVGMSAGLLVVQGVQRRRCKPLWQQV